MNTAQNLEDELQDHKKTELAEAQQRSPGPRSPRGGRGRVSATGTPGAPGQSLRGTLLALSPRLPGGGRGRHLPDGPPGPPGPRPPPGVALATGARAAGRALGGLASALPGIPGCSGPCPGPDAGTSKGPAPFRGARLEAACAARAPRAGAPYTASRGPHAPRRARSPAPTHRALPLRPAVGRAPQLGGPALRTRGGGRAAPPCAPHTALRSPPEAGAAAQAPTRALGDAAPGGLGGDPHAGYAPRGRARARARGAGPRSARARAPGAGPSGPRAPRRPWIPGMRTALPAPALVAAGADPGPVKPRPVDER